MRAYSMDLRERVWADCQAGMKTPAVSQKYSVSESWVRRLKQRQRATGSLARRPPSPGRPVTLAPHEARVRELVRDDPDATLDELRRRASCGASVTGRPGLDPKKLVLIDETGANTKMTRRYGRAPIGRRVVGRVPHGHWKTTTFVGALRSEGLVAPMVIDGAMNGDLFVAYARQVLVPALVAGDVVVMDNLASHKRVAAVRAITEAGCTVVYLPPYSPD